MVPTIEPCPFCSAEHTHITKSRLTFYVVCQHCNSSGPRHRQTDDAIKEWNALSQAHEKAQYLNKQYERMQRLLGQLYQIESGVEEMVRECMS